MEAGMEDVIHLIKNLPDSDFNNLLYGLQNLKSVRDLQGQKPETEVPLGLPPINLPAEYLLPCLEYLFMMFLRELGNNFNDDYKRQVFNKLTNNNSLKVNTYFDRTTSDPGQYPRAVVKVEQMSLSPEYIGNMNEKGTVEFSGSDYSFGTGNSVQASFSVRIDIIDQAYPATNTLASIVCHNLAANVDKLREVFSLQQITMPTLIGAQKVREYNDLYMATISFNCLKQVSWTDMFTEKTYSNFYHKIIANADGEVDPGLATNPGSGTIGVGPKPGYPGSTGEEIYNAMIHLSIGENDVMAKQILDNITDRGV